MAFTRSMEYTDGSYTTPNTAANSYVPADHAVSSDGITYGYRMDGNTRVITVTIPADYTGSTVNVNMAAIREVFGELSVGFVENGQVVAGGYQDDEAMAGKTHIVPGQTLPYRIEIINLSGQKYTYQSGSLWMDVAGMENYSGYTSSAGTYPAFDSGEQVFVMYRTWNKALSALLDSSKDVLDDATINAALQTIYQNEDSIEVNLPHYYLDYYNFAYNTSAKTLEELSDEAIMDLFGWRAGRRSERGRRDSVLPGDPARAEQLGLQLLLYSWPPSWIRMISGLQAMTPVQVLLWRERTPGWMQRLQPPGSS